MPHIAINLIPEEELVTGTKKLKIRGHMGHPHP